MTSQTPRARTARGTALTAVGWLLVTTGGGHATLVAVSMAAGVPAAERPVRDVMAATSVPIAGIERSHWELFMGFSLMMALMLVGLGSLTLLVRHTAPDLAHGTRGVLVLLGLVLVPAMLISVLLLPPPPIVLLGLALVAVVVGLVRDPAGEVEGAAGQG
ncbi:LIC_13387 family protein [Nocardioides sp.]|uniref:LIC_13387 family protein n=1 Tax=Nocardioides sp. TaxID=35761 RepID=UPI002B980345|nr:hypothetical protein [Nocardioides sp.]HXH80695.1 hypothetical protein [Nocardioides sp.]